MRVTLLCRPSSFEQICVIINCGVPLGSTHARAAPAPRVGCGSRGRRGWRSGSARVSRCAAETGQPKATQVSHERAPAHRADCHPSASAGPYVTAPHSQHHVRWRPHEHAKLPTNILLGRSRWPRGQRVGGRAIHWPDVECTSSPRAGLVQLRSHLICGTLVLTAIPASVG